MTYSLLKVSTKGLTEPFFWVIINGYVVKNAVFILSDIKISAKLNIFGFWTDKKGYICSIILHTEKLGWIFCPFSKHPLDQTVN